jgi:hypothetical protein
MGMLDTLWAFDIIVSDKLDNTAVVFVWILLPFICVTTSVSGPGPPPKKREDKERRKKEKKEREKKEKKEREKKKKKPTKTSSCHFDMRY